MSHDTLISTVALAGLVAGTIWVLLLAYLLVDRAFPRMRMGHGIITDKRSVHPKASVTVKFSLRDGGSWRVTVFIGKEAGDIIVSEEEARRFKIGNQAPVRYFVGRISKRIFIREIKET